MPSIPVSCNVESMASGTASPGKQDVAFLTVSLNGSGLASLPVNLSEGGVASGPVSPYWVLSHWREFL